MRDLGDKWFEHPDLEQYDLGKGIERIYEESDKFLASLGYEHDRYTGRYKVVEHSDKRVALFAHQGFGLSFLSTLLDIPYSQFATRFDMGHSSVTVIKFGNDGFVVPRVLQLSNDSHIFASDMETKYHNEILF